MARVVVGTMLECATCDVTFTRPPKSSRLHCEKCRPPRARGKAGGRTGPTPAANSPSTGAGTDKPLVLLPGRMEKAVAAELAQFGREGSVSGVAALMMAAQADQGINTGSQLAMLLDKVQAAVDKAIKGVPPKGDDLDRLQTERADRLAAQQADDAARGVG